MTYSTSLFKKHLIIGKKKTLGNEVILIETYCLFENLLNKRLLEW